MSMTVHQLRERLNDCGDGLEVRFDGREVLGLQIEGKLEDTVVNILTGPVPESLQIERAPEPEPDAPAAMTLTHDDSGEIADDGQLDLLPPDVQEALDADLPPADLDETPAVTEPTDAPGDPESQR